MKGIIKIKENNDIEIIYQKNDQDAMDVIRNHYSPEFVYPINLNASYCMIVDVEGYRKELNTNKVGSYFYGSFQNGFFILGDIFIVKSIRDNEGLDIGWISENEILEMIDKIKKIIIFKL